MMNVWVVHFSEDDFSQYLYEKGLSLVGPEYQRRIQRFYHKKDSYRCLLGRLLPLLLLNKFGVSSKDAELGRTEAGKPFISSPLLTRSIGFNISHDNGYVVMAYQALDGSASLKHPQARVAAATEHAASAGTDSDAAEDALAIGIDVMKVTLLRYEKNLESFVEHISDALTPFEKRTLLDHLDLDPNKTSTSSTDEKEEGEAHVVESGGREEDEEGKDKDSEERRRLRLRLRLRQLFFIWTVKEAYTKALGLGLGFNFRRIEVDVLARRMTVDGAPPPNGWEIVSFLLEGSASGAGPGAVEEGQGGGEGGGEGDVYQVAVARRVPSVRIAGACGSGSTVGSLYDAAGIAGRIEVLDINTIRSGDAARDWLVHLDSATLIERVC